MSTRFLRIAALLSGIASATRAATINACVPDTLLAYYVMTIDGGRSCSIGNQQFLNFNPVGGISSELAASIGVVPLDLPHRPTIEFVFDRPMRFGSYLEVLSGFTIRVLPGGRPISQATEIIADSYIKRYGFIVAHAYLCAGAVFINYLGCDPAPQVGMLRARQNSWDKTWGYARFDEQSGLGVMTDFTMEFGYPDDFNAAPGFFGSVVIEFQEVPEPGSVLLTAFGLALIWRLRRAT